MNKKGKILMALAIGAVVILVGSSVVRCTLVHQDETVGQIVPVESEDNQAQPNTLDTSSQKLPADVKNALAILKSSVWTADGGKSTIAFKDGRYAESDGVANNMTAFDVKSVTRKAARRRSCSSWICQMARPRIPLCLYAKMLQVPIPY